MALIPPVPYSLILAINSSTVCASAVKVSGSFGKPLYPSDVDMSQKPDGSDEYQFFVNKLRKRVDRLKEMK